MTEPELVRRKLALIEGYLADLRALEEPDLILTDIRIERFAEHTLQLAIQASLDVASHIVSHDHLGEAGSNAQLFALIARHGWLPADQVATLARMAGFRNVLVHGYAAVEPSIVRDVVVDQLGDLDAFVGAIRARL